MSAHRPLHKSVALLGVCLAVALVTAAPVEASLTALNTNQIIYQPGDPFVLTLILSPEGFTSGDLYVQIMLPNGAILFLNEAAQFTATARPFRPNLTITVPSQTEIFSGGFPFALQGTYALQAIQVLTGSDPTNPDNLIGTGFPVRIAFVAPTSPVGTVMTIPVDSILNGDFAVNPKTQIAVVSGFPKIVKAVNLITGKVIASIPMTLRQPRTVAVNPNTNVAVVSFVTCSSNDISTTLSCSGPPGLVFIDLNTNRVTGSLLLPNAPIFTDRSDSITNIAIDSQSNRAVVGNLVRSVPDQFSFTTIDLGSRQVLSSFFADGPLSAGTSLTLNPSTNELTVARVLELVVIDLATGQIRRRFPLDSIPLNPLAIAGLPDRNGVVISGIGVPPGGSSSGAAITILDLTTGATETPVFLPDFQVGFKALAINPATNQVFVGACPKQSLPPFFTFPSPKLILLDLAPFRLVSAFDLPSSTSVCFDSLAVNPVLNTVLFPSFVHLLQIQPQGFSVSPQVAPLRGVVLASGTGAPVSGATVAVQQTGLAGVSDASGQVFFSGVPVGPQIVTISAAGFAPTSQQALIQTGQMNEVTITLLPQAAFRPLTGVVVSGIRANTTGSAASVAAALSRSAPQVGRWQPAGSSPDGLNQGPLSCSVPPNATAIPGATVALPSSGNPTEATTGASGTFFLTQAPAGTVLVAVRAPGKNPTTQLTTIEQSLENCIVVTLLPTLNPDAPTIEVALNRTSFRPGETLTLDRTITLAANASPTPADEYVLGVLPDGQTVLSLVPGPAIDFGVKPFRSGTPVLPAAPLGLRFTFGGGEPVGTYQVVGRLVKPGGNPLNPADWLNTTTTSFSFGP